MKRIKSVISLILISALIMQTSLTSVFSYESANDFYYFLVSNRADGACVRAVFENLAVNIDSDDFVLKVIDENNIDSIVNLVNVELLVRGINADEASLKEMLMNLSNYPTLSLNYMLSTLMSNNGNWESSLEPDGSFDGICDEIGETYGSFSFAMNLLYNSYIALTQAIGSGYLFNYYEGELSVNSNVEKLIRYSDLITGTDDDRYITNFIGEVVSIINKGNYNDERDAFVEYLKKNSFVKSFTSGEYDEMYQELYEQYGMYFPTANDIVEKNLSDIKKLTSESTKIKLATSLMNRAATIDSGATMSQNNNYGIMQFAILNAKKTAEVFKLNGVNVSTDDVEVTFMFDKGTTEYNMVSFPANVLTMANSAGVKYFNISGGLGNVRMSVQALLDRVKTNTVDITLNLLKTRINLDSLGLYGSEKDVVSFSSFVLDGDDLMLFMDRWNDGDVTLTTGDDLLKNGDIYSIDWETGEAVYTNKSEASDGSITLNVQNGLKYAVLTAGEAVKKTPVPTETPTSTPEPGDNNGGGTGGTGTQNSTPAPTAATTAAPATGKFKDVSDNNWAKVYIEKLAARGIVNGDENGNFNPDNKVTREQFLKMIIEAFGFEKIDGDNVFYDVDENSWYKIYIMTGRKLGIVQGISSEAFGVGMPVSRQDMTVMAMRAAEKRAIDYLPLYEEIKFTDKDKIAAYAREAVKKVQMAGIISGFPDGSFGPEKQATRAEATKIICLLAGF